MTWIPEEHRDRVPYWIPLGRFGRPDDGAGCALFLASELSAWVTGNHRGMDGGALAAGGFYRVPGVLQPAGRDGRRHRQLTHEDGSQ